MPVDENVPTTVDATLDRPADGPAGFRAHPRLFVASLVLFAVWITALILLKFVAAT